MLPPPSAIDTRSGMRKFVWIPPISTGDLAHDGRQRSVQHGRVLPLEQPNRADVVAEREIDIGSEERSGDLRGAQLVLGRDGREDARERDRVDRARKRLEETRETAGVERRDLA